MPVKFKTFLLLLMILNAGAWALAAPDVTAHVEDLGMGTKTKWANAPYARNPWDMQTFRGKLYIGSGNSANSGPSINAGPVPIISFDPLTGEFTHTGAGLYENDGLIGTEQIDLFRVLEDGKLYIPSHDPVGTCNENYIMDQDGWLAGPGVAQTIHTYDLAFHEGRFFAAQGASHPPVRSSADLINWYQRSMDSTVYLNRLYSLLQVQDQLLVMSSSFSAVFHNGVFEYRSESDSFYKRDDLIIPNMFPDPPSDIYAMRAIRPKRLGSSAVYLGGSDWNDHQFLPRGGVWVADSLVEDALDVRRLSFPDGFDTFDTWDETDNPEGGDVWDMIVKDGRIYAVSSIPGLWTGSERTDPESPRLIQVWESTDRTTFTELFRFTASTFVRSMEILNGDFYFGLGCAISDINNWDPNELHPDTGRILRVKAEHAGWAAKPEVFVDSDGDAYFHDQTTSRFIIHRTGCTLEPITVGYTLAGTAVSGVDYQALPGEVTIPAGETSAEVIIQPLAAAPQAGDKRAVLTLSTGESYRRTDPATATVRILRTVVVTIMVGADAHEDGEVPGHFIVQRSQARPTALELRFSTSGSARSGTDYVEDLGTRVTIPAGESQTTMTVTPIDNDVIGDKTLTLSLWGSSSYWRQYTKHRATIRIHDNDYNRVIPPTFDPDGGEHLGDSVDITVTCATEVATIRYTTDGTDPTEESPTVASGGSVALPISGTLKAKAWKDGMFSSRVASADYTSVTVFAPNFNPDGGNHPGSSVDVVVACATEGATIRYTTNGDEPTEESATVDSGGSVSVPVPGTLKAKAWKNGDSSAVKSADYTVAPNVLTPAFAPDGGEHIGYTVNITVTCATEGATIRYTTNGDEPTEESATVDSGGSVSVPSPGTLKARAWKAGLNPSAVKSADYTLVNVLTPAFAPDGGDYIGIDSVDVTVTCATEGATIRYTTNGDEPTEESATVASGGSVSVPVPGTLKARAWKDGMNPSAVKSADYSEGSDAGGYMVIDVSGGPDASSYPVSYLDSMPDGGWTEEYKTTKLVLRRIPAGTFTMGSPSVELGRTDNETQHQVTLTKDFYIGVFQITQKQWERVMGDWPSRFENITYRDSRPVEQVSYFQVRENPDNSAISPNWPDSSQVHADSFMGKLRARTGLSILDLPTEAQWEYACRAGTTTALNSGKNLTATGECPNMAEVGRYYYNGGSSNSSDVDTNGGTAAVGSYLANQWGLYDMHGNVSEWCLDWRVWDLGTNSVTDPEGAAAGTSRVLRGGRGNASGCRSATRISGNPSNQHNFNGFRLAMTLPTGLVEYTLTMDSGTGGGDYYAGTAVAVTADAPPAGQVFDRWTVDPSETDLGAAFDETQSSTTVTMPAHAVTLTAGYRILRAALGTPYYWLIQHGLASAGDSSAVFDDAELSDPQGKGQPAYHDYIAGLDPNDPGSFFNVASHGADHTGEFTLNWPGLDGRAYRIYRSTTLMPADWQMIDTVIATADGPIPYVDTDPALADGRTFFYLIGVLMAE